MPKDPKKDTSHHYLKKWESEEQFKSWLASVPGNSSRARCKICNYEMQARKSTLIDHISSGRHSDALKNDDQLLGNRRMADFGLTRRVVSTKETKVVEIQVAATIAQNSSIRTVDSWVDGLKKWGQESKSLVGSDDDGMDIL